MSEPPVRVSPAETVAEIRTFGSSVLRQAWRKEHLAVLRAAIARGIEVMAHHAGRTDSGLLKNYYEHGAGNFSLLTDIGCVQPSLLAEMFQASDYHAVCAEYFQDDALYVLPVRLAFRFHDPLGSDRSFVPFHQDSGSQDRRTRDVLNCWIPLDPGAGTEAPGLQVVRTPSEPNFPLKDFAGRRENLVYDPVTIDPDRVLAQFGDQLLAPAFAVGDGFAFSQDVIHRTYVTPTMTKPRTNFEFRVISLKHLSPGASADEVRRVAYRVA